VPDRAVALQSALIQLCTSGSLGIFAHYSLTSLALPSTFRKRFRYRGYDESCRSTPR
jgi:hypothetical protein